jgi:3-deoxy-D-manno-octulosonic-acid transferase
MSSSTRRRILEAIVLWLYGRFTSSLAGLVRLKLIRRSKLEPLYGHAVEERFGHYTEPQSSGWVWIHAVSLGETRVAAILVKQLRLAWPDFRLLLTHGTATGRQEGKDLLRPGDIQVWQPWDCPSATKRFIQHFRPSIGIILETEIWPCLFAVAHSNGVPLALVNARLSERSLSKMLRLPSLMRPSVKRLSLILAQTPGDVARFKTIGGDHAQELGNIKFDAQPSSNLIYKGQILRQTTSRPVVMLASSREGEEELLLTAIAKYRSNLKNGEEKQIQWLIVPRHPQRFEQVRLLCESMSFSVSLRSSWSDRPAESDIWLGDSMGEMPMYYSLSNVALLGGSFKEFGGQNLIESLACACPIICGPHTYNFERVCIEAIEVGAAVRVASISDAISRADQLVQQNSLLLSMQQSARTWLASSRGATDRMVAALRTLRHPAT